jgi:hypothetical protein
MTQPYVHDDTPVQLAEDLERMADLCEEFEPLDAAKLRVAALLLRQKTRQVMVWNLDDLDDAIDSSMRCVQDDEAGR